MENEKIVFEIDISSYLQQLHEAGERIDELRQKQKGLQESTKAGSAEAAAALEKVNQKLKQQHDHYERQRKVLDKYTAAQKKAADVSNTLGKAVEKNTARVVEAGNELTVMAGKSKQAAAGIGKATDALHRYGEVAGDGTAKTFSFGKVFKENALNISVFGLSLKDAGGKIKSMREAFEVAGGGARGFGAAMATTGLPPVIMAVNKAIEVFTSFKPVMDAIAVATDAVSAGFRALLGGGGIAEATVAAGEHTRAMQELADTQAVFDRAMQQSTDTVTDYLEQSKQAGKTDNERRELLKKAADAETTMMDKRVNRMEKELGAKEALFKAGAKLTEEEIKALREGSEEQQAVVYKKIQSYKVEQKYIDEYKVSLLERTKLEGEAAAQRREAAAREMELNGQIKAQQEKAAEEERDRKQKAIDEWQKYNESLKQLEEEFIWDDRKRLEESFKEKLNTIRGNGKLEVELRKRIKEEMNTALEKFDADRKSGEDAKKKEEAEQLADDTRAQERAKLEVQADSLDKRQQLFKLAFQEERKNLEEHNVSQEDIDAIYKKRAAEVEATWNVEELGRQAQHLQSLAQQEMNAVDQSAMSEAEKANRKKAILLQSMQDQLAIAEQIADADGQRTQQEIDNLHRLRDEVTKVKNEIENRKVSAAESMGITPKDMEAVNTALKVAADVVSTIGDVINTVYERRMESIEATKEAEIAAIEESGASEKEKQKRKKEAERKAAMDTYDIQLKQFKANKAISIVQTIIGTAQAVMAQLSNPTPYVGIVLAALAAAMGAAQIGIIASQKPPAPPKFATGVIGLHGPGTETSDSIPAYLSKGESVITARATKRFAPMLAQMEMAVGNIPNYQYSGGHFAGGVIGDGGFYVRESVSNVQNNNAMRDAIAQGFREAPQPVVSVQEIARVNNNVNRSVKVSEL